MPVQRVFKNKNSFMPAQRVFKNKNSLMLVQRVFKNRNSVMLIQRVIKSRNSVMLLHGVTKSSIQWCQLKKPPRLENQLCWLKESQGITQEQTFSYVNQGYVIFNIKTVMKTGKPGNNPLMAQDILKYRKFTSIFCSIWSLRILGVMQCKLPDRCPFCLAIIRV